MLRLTLAAFLITLSLQPAFAAVEPSFDPSKPPAVTPWFGNVDAAGKAADLSFISGMRPHHAGALSMSEEYLRNPESSNSALRQLAQGIIHNQKFEILMLDTVQAHLDKISPAEGKAVWAQIATKGLAQRERFTRHPMPGAMDRAGDDVTAEDVRFAKAMIIHHQGALDMANAYLADPAAQNGYLRQMCQDILLDQKQEIAFMRGIISGYKGNPDEVKIDPSMVHGMEGMDHHHAPAAVDQHDAMPGGHEAHHH